mmetsp:Transcript_103961/g.180565  ORF Transcript_103961/g.180565 Transcript_103961/m.180565 type:complete len:249 (-) Transcript_103961:145-891(-)
MHLVSNLKAMAVRAAHPWKPRLNPSFALEPLRKEEPSKSRGEPLKLKNAILDIAAATKENQQSGNSQWVPNLPEKRVWKPKIVFQADNSWRKIRVEVIESKDATADVFSSWRAKAPQARKVIARPGDSWRRDRTKASEAGKTSEAGKNSQSEARQAESKSLQKPAKRARRVWCPKIPNDAKTSQMYGKVSSTTQSAGDRDNALHDVVQCFDFSVMDAGVEEEQIMHRSQAPALQHFDISAMDSDSEDV